MKIKINPMSHQDKVYGTATVGARGQVVIPVEARKDLKLKPGDRLMVLGKYGKALSFIKADEINDIINMIVESVEGHKDKQEVLKYIKEVLNK